MESFPKKLRTLRTRRKMSQRELARRMDITQGQVHFLETAQRRPSAEFVVRLAQLFDVPLDYLMLDEVELPE